MSHQLLCFDALDAPNVCNTLYILHSSCQDFWRYNFENVIHLFSFKWSCENYFIFPFCFSVQLVPRTEVVVAPKTRKKVLDSRESSCMQSSCMVQEKAMLRVQDLDKRLIYNSNCAGIEVRVVPTSVAFIHPQTAKKFSLNSLELVSIFPRSSGRESVKHSEINDLRKLKGSTAEVNGGERTNEEESRQAIVYLLNSNLVNEGHVMMAQSLRLYLRINLHSCKSVYFHFLTKYFMLLVLLSINLFSLF